MTTHELKPHSFLCLCSSFSRFFLLVHHELTNYKLVFWSCRLQFVSLLQSEPAHPKWTKLGSIWIHKVLASSCRHSGRGTAGLSARRIDWRGKKAEVLPAVCRAKDAVRLSDAAVWGLKVEKRTQGIYHKVNRGPMSTTWPQGLAGLGCQVKVSITSAEKDYRLLPFSKKFAISLLDILHQGFLALL